ncbi:MAG: M66 family metalloprotease [Myxococcaceae bacterium]|nr:M66 family metalloprotease [Myxococcaceae bacterium]
MSRWLSCLLLVACEGTAPIQLEAGPVDGVLGQSGAPRVTQFGCAAAEVEATVPLTCTAGASHPRGAGLSCRLESSTGERIELGDCSAPREQAVRFTTPGPATVRLVVVDDEGQSIERQVSIDVRLPPNQLPRIDDFSATPATGVTPFTARLRVSAVDPDSTTLRCTLSPGGVVPCALGEQTIEVTAQGALTVTLEARDERGGVATRTVTLRGVAPVGDLRVEALLLGQTVVASNVRLVEGKPALVLAQVLADTAGLSNVVQLIARRSGVELGRVTMTGPATVPTAMVDPTRQYRATVPAEWVLPGLELTVRADAMETVPESNETNNEARLTPQVTRRNGLHLTVVPVVAGGVTASVLDLRTTMVEQWPFAEVTTRTRAPYTTNVVPSGSDVGAWSSLLSQLAQVRGADGSQRHYYGLVRVASFGVAGIGYIGQPTAVGRDDSDDVASHELGHNFGRPHAPCGGAAGVDPSYPYAGGRIGSWGWNGRALLNPAQFVDLMSYCNPTWVSDYTYRAAQTFLERARDYGPTPPAAMVLEPSLLVAVAVRGTQVTLEPIHRLHAARTLPQENDLTVRLVLREGRHVDVPLALAQVSEGDGAHGFAIVEDPGGLVAAEVRRSGAVLARHVATDVRLEGVELRRIDDVTVEVRWNDAHAPVLSIAHLTPDTRTTLTLRATGGRVRVRHDGLEGGALELSASSGLSSVRQLGSLP